MVEGPEEGGAAPSPSGRELSKRDLGEHLWVTVLLPVKYQGPVEPKLEENRV